MKKYLKIIPMGVFILSMQTIAFADDDRSYNIISNVSKAILNALSWFALAIAVGMAIWIGIRYVLSGANERANLKGMFPKFMIGMALILLCTLIASTVANIAGNEDASSIIDQGLAFGGIQVEGKRTVNDYLSAGSEELAIERVSDDYNRGKISMEEFGRLTHEVQVHYEMQDIEDELPSQEDALKAMKERENLIELFMESEDPMVALEEYYNEHSEMDSNTYNMIKNELNVKMKLNNIK